jgi:hypothetical protein
MKLKVVGLAILFASVISGFTSTVLAREAPVAKLVQVEGDVKYSRNGTNWRPVRRTKYLFSGYQIKTGGDGNGKLINQSTGMSQKLGPNTHIEVEKQDIMVVSGSLSKPTRESTSIWESLSNKFAKAQRYTTVRRGAGESPTCDNKVRTVKSVTLSETFPDLVWRNACPEFSYRLVIEGQTMEIPAESSSEMIRYTVSGMAPGEYSYHVEVLDKDGTVYIPRSGSTFIWLDSRKESALSKQLKKAGDDVFVQTDLFESNNMHVAAMDAYREYFRENPDDNDMRPLLIKSYQDLKLSNLRENEARLYNASQEDNY